VVASDLPVFVEVAADAATFVPVDDPGALADALQGAIAGEGPPPEVGRVRAARFTWSAVADTMWQLYRELAS
jgi:glycosyltransferase involved in cell wall biosynthesis